MSLIRHLAESRGSARIYGGGGFTLHLYYKLTMIKLTN